MKFAFPKTIAIAIASAGLAVPVAAQQQGGNSLIIAYINTLPKQAVSAQEKADLIHMRQEEKLARDVYTVLYDVWKIRAFQNIAKSEQSHMDLVKFVMDRYLIADPLKSDKVGVFPDAKFTQLFNVLVLAGIQSQAFAEVVGCFIEDLDIVDLNATLKNSDNRDLDTVWQNLQRGSRNHMRAFYGLLATQKLYYPGILLSSAEIQSIVKGKIENTPVDETGKALR